MTLKPHLYIGLFILLADRQAESCWRNCLDTLLQVSDCLAQWRTLGRKTLPSRATLKDKLLADDLDKVPWQLAERLGLWGVLLAGQVATALARYVMNLQ